MPALGPVQALARQTAGRRLERADVEADAAPAGSARPSSSAVNMAARAGSAISTAAALVNVARMSGATVGVAVLGALYAVAGGGSSGLRQALVVGGLFQFASAVVVWRAARP